MEYIAVNHFLEQSKEVQDILKDWWYGENPSNWDIVSFEDDYRYTTVLITLTKYPNEFDILDNLNNGKLIPLFDEGKIRKFIEKTTGSLCEIHNTPDGRYVALEGESLTLKEIKDRYSDDLLQSWWKLACIVANNTNLKLYK